MGGTEQLTSHELTKAQALAYKDAGLPTREIAEKTGMSLSALGRLFTQSKLVNDPLATGPLIVPTRKVGSGRPPKITEDMKKGMEKALKKDPTLMAKQLKNKVDGMTDMKVRTIQDVLCRVMGLRSELIRLASGTRRGTRT